MKKVFFISAAVALLATSCNLFKSRDFDDSNNPQSSVSTDSAAVTTAPNSTATQADSTVVAVPEHKEEATKGSKK
ncbi:MAG TPA: hypothetical protein PLL99_02420 [Chitinophagales bacterium]|jgi:hypothetical protein|nr:hypothetical protein [Chitinophagales bacterium]HQG38454.1 hypothetical protein [Chitinophagales bacterium]